MYMAFRTDVSYCLLFRVTCMLLRLLGATISTVVGTSKLRCPPAISFVHAYFQKYKRLHQAE